MIGANTAVLLSIEIGRMIDVDMIVVVFVVVVSLMKLFQFIAMVIIVAIEKVEG